MFKEFMKAFLMALILPAYTIVEGFCVLAGFDHASLEELFEEV